MFCVNSIGFIWNKILLLKDLRSSNISGTTKPLGLRTSNETDVEFKKNPSKLRKLSQGSVISPTLFNIYMRKLPKPNADLKIILYAVYCTVLTTRTDITQLCATINSYLTKLSDWMHERIDLVCQRANLYSYSFLILD